MDDTKFINTVKYILVALMLVIAVISAIWLGIQDNIAFNEQIKANKIEDEFITMLPDNYRIYNVDELTHEILGHRAENDAIIVERVVGVVTNAECYGDGRITNTNSERYNYITYADVDFEFETGTKIITYNIYNPHNNYIDDIAERFDFKIS